MNRLFALALVLTLSPQGSQAGLFRKAFRGVRRGIRATHRIAKTGHRVLKGSARLGAKAVKGTVQGTGALIKTGGKVVQGTGQVLQGVGTLGVRTGQLASSLGAPKVLTSLPKAVGYVARGTGHFLHAGGKATRRGGNLIQGNLPSPLTAVGSATEFAAHTVHGTADIARAAHAEVEREIAEIRGKAAPWKSAYQAARAGMRVSQEWFEDDHPPEASDARQAPPPPPVFRSKYQYAEPQTQPRFYRTSNYGTISASH